MSKCILFYPRNGVIADDSYTLVKFSQDKPLSVRLAEVEDDKPTLFPITLKELKCITDYNSCFDVYGFAIEGVPQATYDITYSTYASMFPRSVFEDLTQTIDNLVAAIKGDVPVDPIDREKVAMKEMVDKPSTQPSASRNRSQNAKLREYATRTDVAAMAKATQKVEPNSSSEIEEIDIAGE